MDKAIAGSDKTVRMSDLYRRIFIDRLKEMYGSISRAASSCALSRSGKHRFSGYPRESARCRSCGVPLFREAPHG